MDKTRERMAIVTSLGGALLELQEVVNACCEQTIPADGMWDEDDELEIHLNVPVAQEFLEKFDPDDLSRKLQQAQSLIAESQTKLFAYRLETRI